MVKKNATHNMKLFPTVRLLLPTLAKAEKRAASFLLEHPDEVLESNLIEFAERTGSSQASVIRLCKTIGLKGFKQLRTELARQIRDKDTGFSEEIAFPESASATVMTDSLKEVFTLNVHTLQDTFALVTDQYDLALKAILKARQLAFFSIGNGHMPCQYAYMMFRRIGYACSANSDPDLQMIDACNLEKGDVALAVSHTGQTRNVVTAMELAKKHGATTICITKHVKSPLTKVSDICLYTATADASAHMEVVARRIAEYAILEAFYHAVRTTRPATEAKVKDSSKAMLSNKFSGFQKREKL